MALLWHNCCAARCHAESHYGAIWNSDLYKLLLIRHGCYTRARQTALQPAAVLCIQAPMKEVPMKPVFKPLLIAGLLASLGFGAIAQSAGQTTPMPHGPIQHRMDPSKMKEMVAKRQADLKARLTLSAGQEAAWNEFVTAMQPPADGGMRMGRENRQKMREEMQALTTPQRIDRMTEMKAQRDAAMAKRGDATKAFYAALTPEQQKVFDDSTLRQGGRQGGFGKPGHHG